MATPEQLSSQKVRLRASEMGLTLFRNNTGAFSDETGRLVRFGLGNESKRLQESCRFGDYIGFYEMQITKEMVGKTVAVFANIEVKPEGKIPTTLKRAQKHETSREAGQLRAIKLIRNKGGMAWFASCEFDVDVIIKDYLTGVGKL